MACSSTYAGIKQLARTRRDCRFYALETAPHYRRYIGALDVACAAVRARFDPRPCGPGVLEAPRRWRAGCRESARYCGGDGVRGAERVRDTVAAMACWVPRECTHRSVLVASLDVRGCYAALAAHASQLVWFRRLFVVFSAYTYANRLVAIE